jgi:branched-chain amino acid transport system permease protein
VRAGWSHRRLADALRTWLSLSILLAALCGIVSIWGNEYLMDMTTSFLIVTVMVVAWQTFTGNSGIVSFGHVAFFAIGAYGTGILTIPPEIKEVALPSLPPMFLRIQLGSIAAATAAAVASGVMAVAIGLAFARMKANAMGMATFALLVMMYSLILNWDSVTRGGRGIYGIPCNVTLPTALIALVILVGVALLFKASPTGLRLQASRDDPLAAQAVGVHIVAVRLAGWVLSAIIMAAGGSLWAQTILAFGPSSFYFSDTFNMLAMLIIGGQASVTGAVAGCALVTVISELFRYPERGMTIGSIQIPELPGLVHLVIAVLIMLVLILRPSGLLGSRELRFRVWQWLRTLKKRRLI